jgi:hypothetical protein
MLHFAFSMQTTRRATDEESTLILQDPRKVAGEHAKKQAMRHNRDGFARLASINMI